MMRGNAPLKPAEGSPASINAVLVDLPRFEEKTGLAMLPEAKLGFTSWAGNGMACN